MSVILPVWAIGSNITSVLLTPQLVNATTGALTDTTPTIQFFANLQDIQLEAAVTMENISAMDRPYENNVPIEQKASVGLTEIEKYAGTNLAAAAAFGAKYWKYVITRGAQSFTGYGVFAGYTMDGTKQKVTAQFKLDAIDVNTAPLIYG